MIRKSKKKNRDYRNRNEVCPDAPNVPETAMERRYPLCPMQKRKTACACFRQIHVRLVSWKAFYIEHAIRCRIALVGRVSRSLPATARQTRWLGLLTGRQMIQQKRNHQSC
jgi:hypothetical protein